jgi:hypothetical protein
MKYKVGKEIVYDGRRAVITAVNGDGTATLNYAPGSGKTGFAGTLPSISKIKSNNPFTVLSEYEDGSTLDAYFSFNEDEHIEEAAKYLEEVDFYRAEEYEAKKYGSRDEFDSWEANASENCMAFIENYLESSPEVKNVIANMITKEQEEFILDNSDESYRNSFIADRLVSPDELDYMLKEYVAAASSLYSDKDEDYNGDSVLSEESHEELKEDFTKFIADDKDKFAKLVESYTKDLGTNRETALRQIGSDFYLSRLGYGVGFSDRVTSDKELGKHFDSLASSFVEKDMVLGDNNKIYFE